MKSRFSTIDLIAAVSELQTLLHMRLINVYDIDNKTYLFKLSRQDEKAVLLIESGNRIHMTEYEWPKNPAPSSFTMKLRKHIHNRRLEQIKQVGVDRIVDLQFGCNEAAYHVILELYDKGNLILTDYEYTILNVLRPRTENENIRLTVHEKYHLDVAKQQQSTMSRERLQQILLEAKEGESLKKILNPCLEYGPALIEHVLLKAEFPDGAKLGKHFDISQDIPRLIQALVEADRIFCKQILTEQKGFIIQKEEKKMQVALSEENNVYLAYTEYHPFLFYQHQKKPYLEFPSFNKAVDEYFSSIESQKLDLKVIQKEKEALKKLENVKNDHKLRISSLQKAQEEDRYKAELIEMNLELVEQAITVVRQAIANQLHWKEISNLIAEATQQQDPVAKIIKSLKLEINNITLLLNDPYGGGDAGDDEKQEPSKTSSRIIDIDLDLSAYANAKKYYDKKRKATMKEQKTLESTNKASKSAEKKTKQTLKEAATIASINKARRTHWFEKFVWFISSENYLIIGGHDQQQNEMIVKRYMRPGDIYVHADLHGASSIIIKNPSGHPVPPKTLNEAGTMAVCSSAAWESKVVTSAWWVYHEQVSKTAPTGEYLTTGSFMIRGKKNYLPPCYLIMGFGFLFKLDDESIINHLDERKVKTTEELSEFTLRTDIIEEEVTEIVIDGQNESGNEGEQVEKSTETSDVEEKNEAVLYPDTIIDLEHIEGEKYSLKTSLDSHPRTEESIIFLGDEQPVIIQAGLPKKPKTKQHSDLSIHKETTDGNDKESTEKIISGVKRGQKYKLKKIKEKYKDQDEEDRELAMAILQPAGEKKKKAEKNAALGKQTKKKGNVKQPLPHSILSVSREEIITQQHQTNTSAASKPVFNEEMGSDDEKEAKQQAAEDSRLLDALTGIPCDDDCLLYAIPVCAPYNAILNYKFKVKLTPGTNKRGKAAKAALNIFMHDKTITSREKDLLRSVKDQDISRNLPGKVKLSTSYMLKQKR